MDVRKLLGRELKALARQFEGIKLRYKYDWETNAHVVEVPKSIYETEKFMALALDAYSRFGKRFPCVMFAFIPDDSEVGLGYIKDCEAYTVCSPAQPQAAGLFSALRRAQKKVAQLAAV